MDEQEFLESMEDVKGQALERVFDLLSGTSDDKDDNLHSILDSLILQTFGRAFIIGATEQRQGKVEFIGIELSEQQVQEREDAFEIVDMEGDFRRAQKHFEREAELNEDDGGDIDTSNEDDYPTTLGSCGCTDYHMADCPLRTG